MSCTGKTQRNVQSYGKHNFISAVKRSPIWCSSRCRDAGLWTDTVLLTKHIERKLERSQQSRKNPNIFLQHQHPLLSAIYLKQTSKNHRTAYQHKLIMTSLLQTKINTTKYRISPSLEKMCVFQVAFNVSFGVITQLLFLLHLILPNWSKHTQLCSITINWFH